MTRRLSLCALLALGLGTGCSDDGGSDGPTGPGFAEACGPTGECDTGLVCRTDDNLCVGSNTLMVNLDFSAPSERRFETMNAGLLSLEDRELIADAQTFDPSLVQLFSSIEPPSDWPAQIQFDGVPEGNQWIVITMPLPANETSYADQIFEYRGDGVLLDLNRDPVSAIDAVFYAELPVGDLP